MDEDIFIPLIMVTFVLTLVWMILSHQRWKLQHRGQEKAGDNSLRASELKALMQEAVEEASVPLLARIEMLEEQLHLKETPRLEAGRSELIVEETDAGQGEESLSVPRRGVT